MALLNLHAASRQMSTRVQFVLAIPLLALEEPIRFVAPSPVIGVVYIDSEAPGFFVDDDEVTALVSMTTEFLAGLHRTEQGPFDRIRNVPLAALATSMSAAEALPAEVQGVLELVAAVEPPRTRRAFQLNYDYSDFVPLRGSKA